MKKTLVFLLRFALLQMVLCQCASYQLYQKDDYYNGKLVGRHTYKYDDGQLSSRVGVDYYYLDGTTHKSFSTVDYQVRKTASGIDSISMSYGSTGDTNVFVCSFNRQGVILSEKQYCWKWNGRDLITEKFYDSKGLMVRDSTGNSQCYYYYDSLNRYVGYRNNYKKIIHNYTILPLKNEPVVDIVLNKSEGDTILYSWDGKYTTKNVIRWTRPDSTWRVISKTVYEPDEKGRIVSDSASDKKQTMEYVFDSKGRMRRMYIYDDCPDDVDSIEYFISRTECKYDTKGRPVSAVKRALEYPNHILQKQAWRYHRGHRTKIIYFRYDNGRKRLNFVTTYKYGLLNGKLKKESTYNNRLRLNPVSKYVRKYKRIPLRQSVPQQPA